MSHESWVDRLIGEARERGEFDHLPGEGKPLEDVGETHDALWWIKKWLRREGFSILPKELELRRKLESELEAIWSLPSEKAFRERVEKLNEEIRRHNATVTSGPPTTLSPLDVEEMAEAWRRRREGDVES
jgi:hypothetical protein